jgi:hypothetical protein
MLTHPNITIPKRGQIYSVNDARYFDCECTACPALLSQLTVSTDCNCSHLKPPGDRHMNSCAAHTHTWLIAQTPSCYMLHVVYVNILQPACLRLSSTLVLLPSGPKGLQRYIDTVRQGKGQSPKQYSARYICSLVGDFHRTLLYGGKVWPWFDAPVAMERHTVSASGCCLLDVLSVIGQPVCVCEGCSHGHRQSLSGCHSEGTVGYVFGSIGPWR